jgi:hypothetical protein
MTPVFAKRYQVTIYCTKSSAQYPYKDDRALWWSELHFFQIHKWDWYFRYRMSLLQVRHPRLFFSMRVHERLASPTDLIANIKKSIITRKRQISKWTNKTQQALEAWDQLFPLEETEQWKKAIAKINREKRQLEMLETDLIAAQARAAKGEQQPEYTPGMIIGRETWFQKKLPAFENRKWTPPASS